jgi:hypothetical protein
VLLTGAVFVISLAATLFAKLDVVIVLTFAEDAGLTSTTTLSVEDRVLATANSEIFFASPDMFYYVPGKYVLSVDASLAVAGVPNAAVCAPRLPMATSVS